jgi:L-glyceraldehyde 3-phosphate reductase
MGLDYVDIFYSHRPDPDTPMEETMGALDYIVRSGRALYVGISTYDPEQTRQAARILRELGTPCLIHQPRYNMFDRWIEGACWRCWPPRTRGLADEGIGCISFSPLCQGILTDKYLKAIPPDSRAGKWPGELHWGDSVSPERIAKVHKLNELARARGAWVLRHPGMTSALIGASRVAHIEEAVAALDNLEFSSEELGAIDHILGQEG